MFNFKRKKNIENNEELYFINFNGEKSGPYTKNQILERLFSNQINKQAMIKENNVWKMLNDVSWIVENLTSSAEKKEEPKVQNKNKNKNKIKEKFLEENITCPHCFNKFNSSEINFIAKHIELIGDSVLGPEAQLRFLPTIFNEQGFAIDANGVVCQDMACPNCHLKIPETMLSLPANFFSIVGAPQSGKTYYLATMIWKLRKTLAENFDYSISDTDPTLNVVLNEYETRLFLTNETDKLVSFKKTETAGFGISNQVILNGMPVDLPLPFIFTNAPNLGHEKFNSPQEVMSNIIFYDNGGEHFHVGEDNITNLATKHLTHSNSITFLFDPIIDPRMKMKCDFNDPQISKRNVTNNQLMILNEMISRIRKYTGLQHHEKYNKPLIVAIPKYDAWKDLFPLNLRNTNFIHFDKSKMKYYLDYSTICNVSFIMREILKNISPEIVNRCEEFFSIVYFIPVSSLGNTPEYDETKDNIGIRPENIDPIWIEVPTLLQLWYAKIIDGVCSYKKDGILEIDECKFVGNSLIYTLPGQNKRDTIPCNYFGQVVYSMAINKYIKFPESPTSGSTIKQVAEDDDEFWN